MAASYFRSLRRPIRRARRPRRGFYRWFDQTAFVTPTCTCFGNSGREILRAPGFQNVDIGVSRDFIFHERFRAHFRGEAFNLFNHPNFGLPALSIGSPGVELIFLTPSGDAAPQCGLSGTLPKT